MTTRPTLDTGDLWSGTLANASIRPHVTTVDEPGALAPITNDDLDDGNNQIKAQFYGFYDRIKITINSGLQIAFTGAPVMLTDGSLVAVSPGTLTLPGSSTGFIFVNSSGVVAFNTTAPSDWVPLAYVVTGSSTITTLSDLRDKVVEQVRPRATPPASTGFSTGDIKPTFRASADSGWLLCQGQLINTADYAALFGVLGYDYGGSGAQFRLPDLRGRTLIGAGTGSGLTARTLGASGGAEQYTLTISQMPSHGHSVSDPGHNHPIADVGHSHSTSQTPHTHTVVDPGHAHVLANVKGAALNGDTNDGNGAELSTQGTGSNPATDRRTTGITNQANSISLSVIAATSGVTVQSAGTGIAIANQGGGAPYQAMPPFVVSNWAIKT
jgi:microcystin-dependent protein